MAAVDAMMTSDPARGYASSRMGTPRQGGLRESSVRPGAIPSESNAPQSDYGGFADDQIPSNIDRPRRTTRAIPRVEDKLGLTVQHDFETFLET